MENEGLAERGGGEEDARDWVRRRKGRRENQTRAGAAQTHLKTEKKQGKMRAGAPAREIRE